MEILNVGPLELLFILVLAFIVLGPEGMVSTAGKFGKAIRRFSNSSVWKEISGSYRDLSNFSEDIIRKTGLENSINEISDLKNTVVDLDHPQTIAVQEEKPIAEINKSGNLQSEPSDRDDENQIQLSNAEN